MIFNGTDLSDKLFVEKVDNPPVPSTQITTQSAPGKHGARFVSKKLSTRTIKVEVVVAGTSRADYMEAVREIAKVLYAPDVARLSGLPGDDHYYNATFSNWTMEKLMTIGKGSIEFFCADPFGYGVIRALPFNEDSAFIGAAPTRGVITQTVDSAVGTDVVFELIGTGRFTRVLGPFSAGDRIEINTEKGYATINGVPAMARVDISSDWFECNPGPARVDTTPNTLVGGCYTYLERWL